MKTKENINNILSYLSEKDIKDRARWVNAFLGNTRIAEEKQCIKCGELKELGEFRTGPRTGRNQCRECKKAKQKARNKAWQQSPEGKAYQKAYSQSPKGKASNKVRSSNRRARKLELSNTLTTKQWQHALNYFNGCCAVCEKQLNDMFGEFKSHADHYIPLTYPGEDNPGTTAQNMIPFCKTCNQSKYNTMPEVWLEQQFGKRKAKNVMARIQEYFDSVGGINA